ncbi:MAG: hypothetical protein NVS4B8_25920 [Herpetosiphon sp.]
METTGEILEAIRQYVAQYETVPGIKDIAVRVGKTPAVVRRHVAELQVLGFVWFSRTTGGIFPEGPAERGQ